MSSSRSLQVKCPTCEKQGPWFEATHGPFCSRRCKLVDLGKWFDEQHRISEPLQPRHFEAMDDSEANETS